MKVIERQIERERCGEINGETSKNGFNTCLLRFCIDFIEMENPKKIRGKIRKSGREIFLTIFVFEVSQSS